MKVVDRQKTWYTDYFIKFLLGAGKALSGGKDITDKILPAIAKLAQVSALLFAILYLTYNPLYLDLRVLNLKCSRVRGLQSTWTIFSLSFSRILLFTF